MERTAGVDMNYLQQGDCLIKPGKIPTEAVVQKKRNVLIEGEHTGHAHRIVDGDYEVLVHLQKIYLRAVTECKLAHEEHKSFIIPPGEYEIDQVREYDHLADLERKVVD